MALKMHLPTWVVADIVLLARFYSNENVLTVYLLVDLFYVLLVALLSRTNKSFNALIALSGFVGLVLTFNYIEFNSLFLSVLMLSTLKCDQVILLLCDALMWMGLSGIAMLFSLISCTKVSERQRLRFRRVVSHLQVPAESHADENCSICLDDMGNKDECKELPCKHVFHKVCIVDWAEQGNNTCPNCRAAIMQDSVQEP